MTSFLVLGLPKTGTSALYAAIKKACSPLSIYEPDAPSQIEYLMRAPAEHKLAKVMLPVFAQLEIELGSFDKTVLIVRDPRDALVSWLLYRPLLPRNCKNEAFLADFLAALRRKEQDPRAVSVQELFAVLDAHDVDYTRVRDFRQHHELLLKTDSSALSHCTVRYEDYLDGDVAELNEYLGIEVSQQARIGKHLAFNERSKSYGAWKHWFLPSDCAFYRAAFQPIIDRYGYEATWEVADNPSIDPSISSGYVRKHLERLERIPNQYGNLKPRGTYTAEYVSVLESAIGDGAEAAMIELALAHKYGFGVERSLQEAVRLLECAVERGNPTASVHLGILCERGDGVPLDDHRARVLFGRAAAAQGNPRTKRQMASFREAYPETGDPMLRG